MARYQNQPARSRAAYLDRAGAARRPVPKRDDR
jgi:hypothetical protein